MVSDAMYRRMCMSGEMEKRYLQKRRSYADAKWWDRRTKVMLDLEFTLEGKYYAVSPEGEVRFQKHPTRDAVIIQKMTPILNEFVRDKKIIVLRECLPREGVNRLLIMRPPRARMVKKQRSIGL